MIEPNSLHIKFTQSVKGSQSILTKTFFKWRYCGYRSNSFWFLVLFIAAFMLIGCSDSGTNSSPDETQQVGRIQLNINEAYLGIEDTLAPTVTVLDTEGRPITGLQITWSSSNPDVAEVSSNGTITAKSPGQAVIEAKISDLNQSIAVEVFQGIGISSHKLAAIDRAMMDYMNSHGIPGASVAVAKDGRLVHVRGYGYADPESGRVADPETIYRYGSLSKPITSIATMMLLQDGLLSLDDKPFEILHYLPAMPGQSEDPRLTSITLEQLLTQSGGWRGNPRDVDNEVWRAVWQHNVRDAAGMFRYGRGVPLVSDPGTEYAYTNYATQTIGLLIEHVTGTEYEEWVRANLFETIGLSGVKIGKTGLADREPNEARYHRENGERPDADNGAMDYYGASGSWIGRATDLLRLLNAVEGKGGLNPLLSSDTINLMTSRPGFYPDQGSYYAKHWLIIPDSGGLNWHHTGRAAGAYAVLWRMANGISFAVLLNQSPSGPTPDLRPAINGITDWPDHDLFSEFY